MMKRAIALAAMALLLAAGGMSASAQAAEPEILDPALDHPPPFADIVSVDLEVISQKGQPYVQVTWELSGDISGASRNLAIGYNFTAKVGKCDLTARWYAYPQPLELAGYATGGAGALCGTREIGAGFKLAGPKVSVQVPIRDMKSVSPGATMTELRAWTAYLEAWAGDDQGVLAMTGDVATSDKPWTVG